MADAVVGRRVDAAVESAAGQPEAAAGGRVPLAGRRLGVPRVMRSQCPSPFYLLSWPVLVASLASVDATELAELARPVPTSTPRSAPRAASTLVARALYSPI